MTDGIHLSPGASEAVIEWLQATERERDARSDMEKLLAVDVATGSQHSFRAGSQEEGEQIKKLSTPMQDEQGHHIDQ